MIITNKFTYSYISLLLIWFSFLVPQFILIQFCPFYSLQQLLTHGNFDIWIEVIFSIIIATVFFICICGQARMPHSSISTKFILLTNGFGLLVAYLIFFLTQNIGPNIVTAAFFITSNVLTHLFFLRMFNRKKVNSVLSSDADLN